MWTLILLGVFGLTYGVPLKASGSRIIGGVDAPEHYVPHMVSLVWQRQQLWQICGGSLIARRLTLTAAHCVTLFQQGSQLDPTFYGLVGSKSWYAGTEITFSSHHIHPEWDEVNIKNDIALLVLSTPVELGDNIRLIELGFDIVGGNEQCWVAGWGRTGPSFDENTVNLAPTPDYAQMLNVSTLTTEQCATAIAAHAQEPIHDGRVEICTFHSAGHGMCSGDSGSALVSRESGLQVGVVSWGIPCAVGAPDVYARVSGVKTRRFITRILEEFRN